jgi:hypothetical protein
VAEEKMTRVDNMTSPIALMDREARWREAIRAQQAEYDACLAVLSRYESVTMDEPPAQLRPAAIYRARWKNPGEREDFRVWINGPSTPTTNVELADHFKRQIERALAHRNSGAAAEGGATF